MNRIAVPQTGEEAYYGIPYKEPFTPLENGYGYLGVVLGNKDGSKIQCCVCGKWFGGLGGHVRQHDGLHAAEYKELFGLKPSTALLCEQARVKIVTKAQQRSEASPIDWHDHMAKVRSCHGNDRLKKMTTTTRKIVDSPEYANENGNCRQQLLWRLKAIARKVGNPNISANECRKHDKGLPTQLRHRFGTYNCAKTIAQLINNRGGKDYIVPPEAIISDVLRFIKEHHRNPTESDAKRGLLIVSEATIRKTFGRFNDMIQAAGLTPTQQWGLIDLPVKEIVIRYCNGESATKLGSDYGVTYATIIKRLRNSGIPIKPTWWYHTKIERTARCST